MARILLLETATEVCSAAIAADGEIIALAEDLQQPNHTARLTLLIEACVKQAGIPLTALDAVAVSRGPGSYTSLRTGASVAKGLCYALDKPLIAVDTLQALAIAQSAIRNPQSAIFIPMLDARRQEVWTAAYDEQLREILPAQPLILQHNLLNNFLQRILETHPAARFVISGNGAKKIGSDLINENMVLSDIQNCSARYLSGLAERFFQSNDFQDISYYEPFYMKLPNITTPNKSPF